MKYMCKTQRKQESEPHSWSSSSPEMHCDSRIFFFSFLKCQMSWFYIPIAQLRACLFWCHPSTNVNNAIFTLLLWQLLCKELAYNTSETSFSPFSSRFTLINCNYMVMLLLMRKWKNEKEYYRSYSLEWWQSVNCKTSAPVPWCFD